MLIERRPEPKGCGCFGELGGGVDVANGGRLHSNEILAGLPVMIRLSHSRERGSTPRQGKMFMFFCGAGLQDLVKKMG